MNVRNLKLPALATVLSCASCSTVRFYAQAACGQMAILSKARPISKVTSDPHTSGETKRKLVLAERLRDFARDELGLPAKRQFHTYADIGRPYVIANVFAAPEFSLQAKEWTYPFAGTANYRGFFDVGMARGEAEALRREGWDVFVGGVRVYSTLGWFRDPVLNTFIGDGEADLAETIFHEMTHTRVYIPGDTGFNEAFATAVAREGVRRWLRRNGDAGKIARYEKSVRDENAAVHLMHHIRGRLEALYSRKETMPVAAMRREKSRILSAARSRYEALKRRGELMDHDAWFDGQFNNARIVSVAAYFDLVPSFERMLRERGGDLRKLYEDVEAMKKLSKDERKARLAGDGPRG
jgi:predicted aminopeptidase